MRKKCRYTPVIATTRNEVIDSITEKKEVIYIEGDAYQAIIDVLKDYSKKKNSRKMGGGAVPFNILRIATSIPAITVPGFVVNSIFTILQSGVAHAFSLSPELWREYELGHDIYESKKKFVLVSKKYSFELDSIADGCILTNNERCPKCGNKYDSLREHCLVCNAHVINMSTKNALKIIKSI